MAENVARQAIWPNDANILVRVVILYVGQGSSAVVFVANGTSYDVLLVDINLDDAAGGIDVPRMMKDLLDGGELYAFVNTHPHDDHIKGVKELSDAVTIQRVWHSGHIPSKKYGSRFEDLKAVIAKVTKANGLAAERVLLGSRSSEVLGEAQCHILAPADYITDEVNEEEADQRRARIHEQCACIKFGKEWSWAIIPGDADHVAFSEHIMYHKKRLFAALLAASHHGSRTFFRDCEDDDPYTDGLDAINPKYVVISAPKREESRHDHPHEDAVELYVDKVGEENVLHTGKDRYSFIFDVYRDDTHGELLNDEAKLSKHYGLGKDDGGDKGGGDGGDGGGGSRGGYTPRTRPTTIGGTRFG
jgi:competence protein ComEC